MIRNISFFLSIVIITGITGCTSTKTDNAYQEEIMAWRTQRIERLKSENGWLNLAGLLWLEEGKNTFGSDSSNDLVFPAGAPAFAGIITKKDTVIRLDVLPGIMIRSGADSITSLMLQSDAQAAPTVLSMGRYSFFIIKRDSHYGIRLRDLESPLLNAFDSIPCFPADTAYRIKARYIPFDSVHHLQISTVINTQESYEVPGRIEFSLNGSKCTLLPFDEGDQFFILFADATSARETYGSGRFLYAAKPDTAGNIILDFNKAYNPPCAFTPFATCPLPPRENLLDVPVNAGEKDMHLYVH